MKGSLRAFILNCFLTDKCALALDLRVPDELDKHSQYNLFGDNQLKVLQYFKDRKFTLSELSS
ncbi:hypothetical protein GCM10028778_15030 [Barrientosiimonas marina]